MVRRIGSMMLGGDRWRLVWVAACLIATGFATAVHAAPPSAAGNGNLYQPGPYGSAADATLPGPHQASYQSAADYGSARQAVGSDAKPLSPVAKSPANQAEPMPFSGAVHDPAADTAGSHGHHTPGTPSAAPAVLSMFASLAVVLGLFLGVMWFLRRGLPKGTRLLTSDVVAVLGRAPLAGRQQMHLIRFGNRLLLISVSTSGAETLAEISDPAEVDRLAGVCQQSHKSSATTAFSHIFRQLSEARGGKTKEPLSVVKRHAEDDNA